MIRVRSRSLLLCDRHPPAISLAFALELKLRLKRSHTNAETPISAEAADSVPALGSGETTEFVDAPRATENTTELLEAKPRATDPVTHGKRKA